MAEPRRLAIAIALRKNDIVDARRIDRGARDQRFEYDCAQLPRVEAGKRTPEFADSGTDRGYDGGAAQGHIILQGSGNADDTGVDQPGNLARRQRQPVCEYFFAMLAIARRRARRLALALR